MRCVCGVATTKVAIIFFYRVNFRGGRTIGALAAGRALAREADRTRRRARHGDAPVVLALFTSRRYRPAMHEPVDLIPADLRDVAISLAIVLKDRRRIRGAAELMAEIVAEPLVEQLEKSGYIIMQKPPPMGPQRSGAGIGADGRARPMNFRVQFLDGSAIVVAGWIAYALDVAGAIAQTCALFTHSSGIWDSAREFPYL